jgi:hypothetical protein
MEVGSYGIKGEGGKEKWEKGEGGKEKWKKDRVIKGRK